MLFAKVESEREEDVWYRVHLQARSDKWTCSCPQYQYRHVMCKHIKAIRGKREYPTEKINYSPEAILYMGIHKL